MTDGDDPAYYEGLHYKRIGRRRYLLLTTRAFRTQVTGATVQLHQDPYKSALDKTGRLVAFKGFQWDMASGAIDTPDMALASLAHDVFCRMVRAGVLDKKFQPLADREFRRILKNQGTPWIRRWYAWVAVRIYQTFRNL